MSNSAVPSVATVIVNWNRIQDTLECLESLQKTTYSNHLIIVVDNGSSDGSADRLKLVPGIELVQNDGNVGYSPACNQGIELAREKGAQYFFLLNNDALVDEHTISELVTAFDSDSRIGIAGAVNYRFPERSSVCFGGGVIDVRYASCLHEHHVAASEPYDTDFVTGAAMMLSRDVVDSVGKFEPTFFAYFEDADLCVRAVRLKWRVVVAPSSKIWHKVSASSGGYGSALQQYYGMRSSLLFVKRNATKAQLFLFCWITFFKLAKQTAKAIVRPGAQQRLMALSMLRASYDFSARYFGDYDSRWARKGCTG